MGSGYEAGMSSRRNAETVQRVFSALNDGAVWLVKEMTHAELLL